ncbi:MAG: glycoside hydrolase family 30 protein [Bacteroidales bacterium]|nr:glycoside hydrolase family 30 protein [Bacteroidales bacterium]
MKVNLKENFIFIIILVTALITACQRQTEYSGNKRSVINPEFSMTEVIVTAKDTSLKLASVEKLRFKPDAAEPDEHRPTIIVDPDKTFQTILGFGGAFTDAAAETFYRLPENKQQEILAAYFSEEIGIGYSFCRTHINSCDFSSSSYAYTEVENDTLLEHFSIETDKQYRIPLIKAAMKITKGKLILFASPWSPPAWMKTNNHMLQGGKLKPEYNKAWANYYLRFIDEYTKTGIPIWGLTVQNEPMAVQTWESCIFTAAEERDFVRDFLGPAVKNSKYPDTKIIIWDHNRGVMFQRAQTVYDDPEASKYVWGTGFHWYSGDHFENVKRVKEAFPDKSLLFTEGCVFPFNMENIYQWNWGERYGESILRDLNNGTVGWVDWNILLDETGGPNHVSNFCFAPIIGDTRSGELHYMNSYYYMGHFSKYIRPGAKRVIASSNSDDLLATSFINPDGSLATVVLNLTDRETNFDLWIDNKLVTTKSFAHSIITMISE